MRGERKALPMGRAFFMYVMVTGAMGWVLLAGSPMAATNPDMTALKRALPTENFTVGTYEPADPEVQGVGGLINFHFVRIVKD